jgi:DNA-binding NtrC family response regulator
VVGEKSAPTPRKLPAFLADIRFRHTKHFAWDWLEGPNQQLQLFVAQLRQAAVAETPLWLIGPSGSGKQTVARILHARGPRNHTAFVAIDCRALQPYLIEALLFAPGNVLEGGHTGTVLFKSPHYLPADLQLRLIDLCRQPPHPVRWMASSEQMPADLVAQGTLLPELAHVLAIWQISLPPLASRWDCLPRWLELWCGPQQLDDSVAEVLHSWHWPGQMRELRQVLQQACQQAAGRPLRREHLPLAMRLQAEHAPAARLDEPWPSLDQVLLAVEKQLISLTMRVCHSNQTLAAQRLGIPRQRLLRRMEALGLASDRHHSEK